MDRLALYTTAHPISLPFIGDWLRSVRGQTDREFDLWIALDSVTPGDVRAAGGPVDAEWVTCEAGATPTRIRERAIERMVDRYPAIVFADSDDLLEPRRVARARRCLERWDVCGCAMRIVDEKAVDLGRVLRPPRAAPRWRLLARANCFGLGNTAYRSSVLRRCLPIPAGCIMEDWFLVTRAWTRGARLAFDPVCGMAYRQHASNMTAVLPPFSEADLFRETRSVLEHYTFVLEHIPELRASHRRAVEHGRARVTAFLETMRRDPGVRRRYLRELNRITEPHIWFDCVAHPALRFAWRN